ncbi:transcriptional repressor [Magnetospirillum aberrantis SpK]|uniref:Ferric uptake regulation protein n=2 Tax=Magnetospirillum TaxID=13134 RepID=A0A7C9QU50_9PROT|nr:transcriptional repressor [Magnetospirillum aberrantis SpK]
MGDMQIDLETLRGAGIRPTRQRVIIMRTIRRGGRRHLTPEGFHRELNQAGLKVALGTVYNTLNQFAAAGLLRRVGFGDRTFYCTATDEHHHFFDEETGLLQDITGSQPTVANLPPLAPGMEMVGVDIVVRVRKAG